MNATPVTVVYGTFKISIYTVEPRSKAFGYKAMLAYNGGPIERQTDRQRQTDRERKRTDKRCY